MQLRTFRGKSMAEALTAVKRELGANALIVHTRTFKVGGVLGVGAREEVEILASPMGTVPPIPPRTRPHPSSAIAGPARAAYAAAAAAPAPAKRVAAQVRTAPAPAPIPTPPPAPPVARPEPRAEVMQVRRRQPPAGAVAPIAKLAIEPPVPLPGRHAALHDELGAIKDMVAKLLSSGAAQQSTPSTGLRAADPLAGWYLKLISSAVSKELAERIVADVRRRVGNNPGADDEAVRTAFRDGIASHIHAAKEPLRLPGADESPPRTIALIGATGVGKTTTVAKLAAQARLTANARVGVISCDTDRIGAIEQLRTYADIVGVPFRVAASAVEMAQARRSFGDLDLLLIDTPGLSPRDAQSIRSLETLLDAANPSEVHLALPASGSESSLLNACRAFAPLRPSRLLFTKLDEAVTYGVILSVAAEVRTELSYLTTGPRIPEQIEQPDPYRLADLIAAA